MNVIEIWAHTDALLCRLLAQLLKTEAVVATEMLQAIGSQKAQRDVVLAAARSVILRESDFVLFEASLAATSKSREVRHAFAHHMWGTSPDLPDALLSVKPKDYNALAAELTQWSERVLKKIPDGSGFVILPRFEKALRPLVSAWTEPELKEAASEAMRANEIVQSLYVLAFIDFGENDSLRQPLLTDPSIKRAVDRAARKKKTP